MVVDKMFAENLVEQSDEYEGVRGVVGVNHVEAFAEESPQRQDEAGGHRVRVFPNIGEKTVPGGGRRITVDLDAVHDLARKLSFR